MDQILPTINDYKKKALNDAGYTGDINTAEWKWLKDICSPYVGTIQDMWRYALNQAGFTGNDITNMQNKMFTSLSLTGAFPNKWYKYWKDHPLEGVGGWYRAGSILDADFTNGRFRTNGVEYASKAAWLTGIGGVDASGVLTIGPYVDPAAPELFTNGDFASNNLNGWTAQLNGASTASGATGAAVLTSDGTPAGVGGGGSGISQSLTTEQDEAYRVVTGSVSGGSVSVRLGRTDLSSGAPAGGTKAAGGPYSDYFSADGLSAIYYVFRSAVGTCTVDSISGKKCIPFAGFVQSGHTIQVEGVTPSSVSGTKTALSLATGGPNALSDEARLIYNASGDLHVEVYYGATLVADLNLGAVAVSTAFRVRFGVKANEFYAQLNDNVALSDTAGSKAGWAFLYVGRDRAANTFGDGTIGRVTIYNGGGADQFYGLIDNAIHMDGDSFPTGSGGVVLWTTLQTASGRSVRNTGVGGDTMDAISARLAASGLKSKVAVIWAGDQNGITTVAAYCDLLAAGVAGYSKFVVIPACVNYGQSDLSVETAIRDEMLARWPNNVLDWRNVLTLDGGGVPVQAMYRDTGTDSTHLSQAAMDLMAPAIVSKMAALGY